MSHTMLEQGMLSTNSCRARTGKLFFVDVQVEFLLTKWTFQLLFKAGNESIVKHSIQIVLSLASRAFDVVHLRHGSSPSLSKLFQYLRIQEVLKPYPLHHLARYRKPFRKFARIGRFRCIDSPLGCENTVPRRVKPRAHHTG